MKIVFELEDYFGNTEDIISFETKEEVIFRCIESDVFEIADEEFYDETTQHIRLQRKEKNI